MKNFHRKHVQSDEGSPLRDFIFQYKSLIFIVVIGVTLSLSLFALARNAERAAIKLNFLRDAEKRLAILMREFAVNLHEIDDLRTYYESSELVTREEFATFTRHTYSQYSTVTAEIWAPRVTSSGRENFEKSVRKGEIREFQITERSEQNRFVRAGNREEYYPVYFVEPYTASDAYAGFDLTSVPEIRETLHLARDTGALYMVKSDITGLGRRDRLEYLVIFPHYRKDALLNDVEGRRIALKGFLIGVLNLEQIIENAITLTEGEPIALYLFDGPPGRENPPVYIHANRSGQFGTEAPLKFEMERSGEMRHEEAINLGMLNLHILLTPTAEYIDARKSSLPSGILFSGIMLTGLLASYIFVLKKHSLRIHQFADNLLKTRDALTRERNRAQRFLDIAGAIIVALNREGEITLVNRRGSEILGYGEGELVGENWFRKCLPEQAGAEVSAIFRKVMDGEMELPATIEYPIMTKSGEVRLIAWQNSFVSDEEGNVIGKLSSGEDVTERTRQTEALTESEQRFRDLVESSLTGILIVQDGEIVYRNPEQERLFGDFTPPMKVSHLKAIHPEDTERFLAMFEIIGSGTRKAVEMEFRYYYRNQTGKKRKLGWAYCRSSAIEFQGKKAVLVNVMDITRARELEMVMKDRMTSLGRVAAGIAHEIRNPLSGINIYVNTLKKVVGGCEKHRAAEDIIAQVQSASGKIESVVRRALDFSRPGEPRFTQMDLNTAIEEAINLSSVSLRKSGIEIEKELSRDLPSCYADGRLFEQVIVNLISNAAEAMMHESQPKRIRVTTSSENNTILVKVADNGPGVPPDMKDKVFDPFFTTKSENTGLGLSISNRIVIDHGGHMDIAESEWGGAEFVIELPRERRRIPR
jgi:PAS domain S-box-containing protein